MSQQKADHLQKIFSNIVECYYNSVQYIMLLHTAMRWQQQNIQQISNSQKTHHISPSRASYGVSVMSISHKIDRVTAAPHCTYNLLKIYSNVTVISYKRSRGRNVIIGIGNELVPSGHYQRRYCLKSLSSNCFIKLQGVNYILPLRSLASVTL